MPRPAEVAAVSSAKAVSASPREAVSAPPVQPSSTSPEKTAPLVPVKGASEASVKTVAAAPEGLPVQAVSSALGAQATSAISQQVSPPAATNAAVTVDAAAEVPSGPTESDDADSPRKHTKRKRRWPWFVAFGVLAVLLAVAGCFSWDRWLRYDDVYDLQGEWQVEGTTWVVVVDDASIKLTDSVSYTYTLDPLAKTIEFAFGDMKGSGHYRFSADRSQLVVEEGSSYSVISTLAEDIPWMWDGIVREAQGQPPAELEPGEGVTVLTRVSHNTTAQPRNSSED